MSLPEHCMTAEQVDSQRAVLRVLLDSEINWCMQAADRGDVEGAIEGARRLEDLTARWCELREGGAS